MVDMEEQGIQAHVELAHAFIEAAREEGGTVLGEDRVQRATSNIHPFG